MNETKEKDAVKMPERTLMSIPLDKVEIEENIRKQFDPAEMKELAANIKKVGVLQNIVVIRAGKGAYTLSAGERRVRAARMAGLTEIPASVYEEGVDPKMLQIFENLHRKDVGPIEEARGFKDLLDEGKHTIEGLAQAVSKTVKYVTRSVRLLELPKAAIKAIEKGTLTPEHGHQILRAPDDKRETFTEYAITPKWAGVLPTIHDLINEIERRLEKPLAQACFPKDREYAGAMACSACPFNTGNQDVLFEGAQDGKCTDGSCFTKKTNLFMREFRDEAAKKFKDVKFAGFAGQDYGGTPREVGEAVVLTPQEAKSEAVKAAMKKDPAKFGFAVLKPSRFGGKSPSAVIVCADREFVLGKLRKAPKEKGTPQMSEEERAREQFVQEQEIKALFAAGAKSLRAIKKANLVDVVLALSGTEEAYEAVGVEAGENIERALAKLTEKELLRLAWLCTVQQYEIDARFGDLGVEVKKVRKEARTEAVAAWERLKKEEAEAQEKADAKGKEAEAATK